MKALAISGAALVATCAFTTAASASVYSDDLSRCLVSKTSDEDKRGLVQWVFASMAASEAVKALTSATAEQRGAYDRQAGALVTRLLSVDCRKETIDAVKYDGPHSIEVSFGLLGQVAFKALTTDPAVSQSLQGFVKYLDEAKLKALFEEAGAVAAEKGKPAK